MLLSKLNGVIRNLLLYNNDWLQLGQGAMYRSSLLRKRWETKSQNLLKHAACYLKVSLNNVLPYHICTNLQLWSYFYSRTKIFIKQSFNKNLYSPFRRDFCSILRSFSKRNLQNSLWKVLNWIRTISESCMDFSNN